MLEEFGDESDDELIRVIESDDEMREDLQKSFVDNELEMEKAGNTGIDIPVTQNVRFSSQQVLHAKRFNESLREAFRSAIVEGWKIVFESKSGGTKDDPTYFFLQARRKNKTPDSILA